MSAPDHNASAYILSELLKAFESASYVPKVALKSSFDQSVTAQVRLCYVYRTTRVILNCQKHTNIPLYKMSVPTPSNVKNFTAN